MKTPIRKLIFFVCAASLAANLLPGQDSNAGKSSPAATVRDVLPKGTLPQAIKSKLLTQRVLVFIDPATGEIRAPQSGEHASLTGAADSRHAAFAAAPNRLPNGGVAVGFQSFGLDYLIATQRTDGTLSTQHASRGPKKEEPNDR